jgi:hypothetical protein
MTYAARVVCDSISPAGARMLTVEATYWRAIHPQMMAHRDFSRGASSNRAMPTLSVLARTLEDPALPIFWGKKARTMQATEELPPEIRVQVEVLWLEALADMAGYVEKLDALGLHKQLANRLLEPWQDITVLYSGTEWRNFFDLRCHPDAQPEERHIATLMRDAIAASTPVEHEWHLPYVTDAELDTRTLAELVRFSVARSARVSYLNHDGVPDPDGDLALYERLATSTPRHAAPFEHVALADISPGSRAYNLRGWMSWRWLTDQGVGEHMRLDIPIPRPIPTPTETP